jgi:hypothetical protein
MKNKLDMLEDGCESGSASKSEKYKLLKSSIHAVRVELNRTNTCVTATA